MSYAKKLWPFAILFLMAGVILWPLLHSGFFVSDDGEWMIIRLAAFHQTLKTGQFPVRFLETLNHGYGYPVTNFLYPLPFYIGEILHLLGLSFINSIKTLFVIDIFGTVVFLFLFLRERFTRVAAIIGAAAFLAHPYLIFDLYKRGSLGELTAVMFAAGTLFLLTKFLRTGQAVFFSFGSLFWAATILSHNTVGLISVPVVFLLPILFQEPPNTKALLYQGAAFCLALLISAFFWLPAISEYGLTQAVNLQVANYWEYFLPFGELVRLLSLPLTIAVVSGFIQTLVSRKFDWLTTIFAIIAVTIFFTTPLSTAFWEVLPLPRVIQFPWRFMTLLLLCFPVGIAVLAESKAGKIIAGALVTAAFVLTLGQTKVQSLQRNDQYYQTNDDTTTVKGEYLTKWMKIPPKNAPADKVTILSGSGTVSGSTIHLETTGKVRINKMYYPGMAVFVNERQSEFRFQDSGFPELELPGGKYYLTTSFGETPLRTVANGLSILGLLGVLAIVARYGGLFKFR